MVNSRTSQGWLPAELVTDNNLLKSQYEAYSLQGALPVSPRNISTKFHEAFQTFVEGERWTVAKAAGDLVFLDGNAAASSYLVVSKDPLAQDTVTVLESVGTFTFPLELGIGLSMSQRTLGQDVFLELVDTDPPMAPIAPLQIASISQATTTLTINYATPHNYRAGQRIGVADVVDSRLNYPSLVVASTPTPLQITCTSVVGAALPSVTAGPFTSGYTYSRPALGCAQNGTSMGFEHGNATNACFYLRSEAGSELPTGTISGSHAVTVSSTASVQPVVSPLAYSFQPSSEYKLSAFVDGVQWSSAPVDTLAAPTNATKRTQVVPNPAKTYKLRIRAHNNRALTVPVAQIVSAAKTGTTTATIVFDRPHGLTLTDQIVAYGVRDVTNFANLVAATAIASIVDQYTITVVWGSAVTATSYGGYVARVNGGNLMSSLGGSAVVVQSAFLATAADGVQVLTLIGSTTWSTLIGNLVNVIGVRDAVTGATLNVDGAYRVRNVATTTLELERMDGSMPANFASINCGGAIIARTDLRLSYVRVLDFEHERVEMMVRPTGDVSSAIPVSVQNVPTIAAVTAANMGSPVIVADVASAGITASANVAAITATYGNAYEVSISVSAVSGTSPTMDVIIQESDDTGLNWFDVYAFPRITATGMYRSPKLPLIGNRIRYVQTLGGTSPSFTRAINRLQSNYPAKILRQIIDRSIVLTTLNSVTPALVTCGAKNAQLVVNIGAATTPPQLKLQGTDDGITWYDISTTLQSVASSTVQLTVNNITADRIRAVVATAGVTVTAGYVLVKAFG